MRVERSIERPRVAPPVWTPVSSTQRRSHFGLSFIALWSALTVIPVLAVDCVSAQTQVLYRLSVSPRSSSFGPWTVPDLGTN